MFTALVAFIITGLEFDIFIPFCTHMFAYEASCFYNIFTVFSLSL